jgi:hypothetical protein
MRFQVIGFYYEVNKKKYDAESRPWLPYATPRFPHVDWSRLEDKLKLTGPQGLNVIVEYAASEPRIFRVRDYVIAPSYYSIGRLFFYALRSSVLSIFWLIWCVALFKLVDGLSSGPDT